MHKKILCSNTNKNGTKSNNILKIKLKMKQLICLKHNLYYILYNLYKNNIKINLQMDDIQ